MTSEASHIHVINGCTHLYFKKKFNLDIYLDINIDQRTYIQ